MKTIRILEEYINKNTIPRTIPKRIAKQMPGKMVTFFCHNCNKRVFTAIPTDAQIHCDVCGYTPQPKKITLVMAERTKMVNDLFELHSKLFEYYCDLMDYYCAAIDEKYSKGLGEGALNTLYCRYNEVWDDLSDVASYIMISPDTPSEGIYTMEGLDRKSYRSDRSVNCINFDVLYGSSSGNDFSASEILEYKAFKLKEERNDQHYNPNFNFNEFIKPLTNHQERRVVRLLYSGFYKCEIEKLLGLSESKLQTILKHIAFNLRCPAQPTITQFKECRICHEVKVATAFSKDRRNKDGLQEICKGCDNQRKKGKIFTGILPKIAS